jgi:hypothetical protein
VLVLEVGETALSASVSLPVPAQKVVTSERFVAIELRREEDELRPVPEAAPVQAAQTPTAGAWLIRVEDVQRRVA